MSHGEPFVGAGHAGARAATDLKRQGYHTRPVRIEARQVASRFAREARRRPSFPAVLKDAFFELGASFFKGVGSSERGSRERGR
jgi:predicted NAD/FAD-dependent oxidoreductase